mgnify:CR=1 FL=1
MGGPYAKNSCDLGEVVVSFLKDLSYPCAKFVPNKDINFIHCFHHWSIWWNTLSASVKSALLFYKLAGCFLCKLSGPSQSPCIVTLPLRNVDLTLADKISWIPGIPLMWAIVDYILLYTGHHLVSLYGKMVYNMMNLLSMVCLPDYMTCYAS